MSSRAARSKLRQSSVLRESLRQRGQFWTPDWVAEAMVEYVARDECNEVFDPAVGPGVFFRAAIRMAAGSRRPVHLRGTEIDSSALTLAKDAGLNDEDLSGVQLRDFINDPPLETFKAIVANPPYIRHHRLGPALKRKFKDLARNAIGRELDGRAGLHVYFLIQALIMLQPGGRLAFIVPADICEGVFANSLWEWIARRFRIEAVVTFAPAASPFPRVDTNPIVLFIRNAEPACELVWATCGEEGAAFRKWVASGFADSGRAISSHTRSLPEALATGLSRMASDVELSDLKLGDLAFVRRGIATGANEFFFLTREQAEQLGITDEYLLPAIGRTRDVSGSEFTHEMLRDLSLGGRPTRLLSTGDRPRDSLPRTVLDYLKRGEHLGVHRRPLVSTRRHWFRVEAREVPPILFAYLGRRNARFIRNRAGVIPLTGFLCVYPRSETGRSVDEIWAILSHPDTASGLRLVAKTYGGGAIKVEPRALERLPIPRSALP